MVKSVMLKVNYRYGAGEIERIPAYLEGLGERSFVFIERIFSETVGKKIIQSFSNSDSICKLAVIDDSCSEEVLKRHFQEARNYDNVIGVGSGKMTDLARYVATVQNCPLIVMPLTIFSDIPFENFSNPLTKEMEIKYQVPNFIVVDTKAIAELPAHIYAKGVGNSLSVYFEVRATLRNQSKKQIDSMFINEEYVQIEKCYQEIMKNGVKALEAVKLHRISKDMDNVTRSCIFLINILYSKEGYYVHGKQAIIHKIRKGLMMFRKDSKQFDERLISFATLVLLVLENVGTVEMHELLSFMMEMGLPINMKECGIDDKDSSCLKEIAHTLSLKGLTLGNRDVTAAEIAAAIVTADSLGTQYILEKRTVVAS